MTSPTPEGRDAVANSQSVDALAASGNTDSDAVAPTTPTLPNAPVLAADDQPVNPNAPTESPDTSSDTVGGPAVVTEAEAEDEPEAAPLFEGTASQEERDEAAVAEEAVQADNAADTKVIAKAQADEDLRFRNENPDSPVVREANPNVGGERF